MKAIVLRKHGNPGVLSFKKTANPKPRKGHVIVKVSCCAVNHLDIWVRKGIPGKKITFPHILGCDICGSLKQGFGNFRKGAKVVVYPVLENPDPLLPSTMIGGFSNYNGGYAELIQVPKSNIVKKPNWFSDIEACALNVSYLTVWNMLEKCQCQKGDWILIWGANGGVGSAAILFAKAMQLKVIAVTSNAKKISKSKKIGADVVIDRNKSNVVTQVLKHTKKQGVNAVIDHVGAKTWPLSIQVLKEGGRLVVCGQTSGPKAIVDIPTVYSKELEILGTYMGTKSQLIKMHKFMRTKKIRPIIDSIFSLHDASFAHKRMESSNHFGKIVLKM